MPTTSPMLNYMQGLMMPIVVSHGEGRARFKGADRQESIAQLITDQTAALRYVDGRGQATEVYPLNPNGSPQGLAGVVNQQGNVLTMMPHPERSFRSVQHAYYPQDLRTAGFNASTPWLNIFKNALYICG